METNLIYAKTPSILRVGLLYTRYRHTVNYLSQTMKITTSTQTYDGEFYQEEGLQGRFDIDLTEEIGMEVDNERDNDEDTGDEVRNLRDIQMFERLCLGNDNEDNIPPSDSVDELDNVDSDDETYDPANLNHEDYF